jgi:hypothetical protein
LIYRVADFAKTLTSTLNALAFQNEKENGLNALAFENEKENGTTSFDDHVFYAFYFFSSSFCDAY